jgi:hypothetical protein
MGGGVASNEDNESDKIFRRVGEFGIYQFVLVVLASVTCLVPSIVAYGFVFYGAVPEFRCKLPLVENDTYDAFSPYHEQMIQTYIPLKDDSTIDTCRIKRFNISDPDLNSSYVLEDCKEWVYSKKYFENTIATRVG